MVGLSETKLRYPDEEPSGELWVTQNYGDALSGSFSIGQTQIALKNLSEYETVQAEIETVMTRRYPNFEVGDAG